MNHFTIARSTVLLGLLCTGCFGEMAEPENARLAVTMQGLSGTTEIEVPPGPYTIEAQGEALNGTAAIDILVLDQDGMPVASSSLRLPAGEARARDGDRGQGSIEIEAEAGRCDRART